VLITAHELWHIEARHGPAGVGGGDESPQSFASLDSSAVARNMATRSHYDAVEVQEADLLAAMFMA
jgi:hypothetical protein